MKKLLPTLVLLILSFSLLGCGNKTLPQSTFKDNFTIGTIVEGNTQYLIPESRQAFSSEYGESEQPFSQKQEEMTLQIEAVNIPKFFTAVRSDIEETLVESGASIVGQGTDGVTGSSFSIQYQQNQVYGTIFVWGVRGEETTYTLIVLITEKK